MDPFFMFSIAGLMRETHMMSVQRLQLKHEFEEQQSKEQVHTGRLNKMKDARQAMDEMVLVGPELLESAVILSLWAQDLEISGAIPGSFEDVKEKEDVVLLWRRMANLFERFKADLDPGQMETCQKCLKAISMRRLVNFATPRLEAFDKLRLLEPLWEKVHAIEKKLTRYQWISAAAAVVFMTLAFLWVGLRDGFEITVATMVLWVLGLLILIAIPNILIEHLKPKNVREIDENYYSVYPLAHLEDREFWDYLKQTFGGMPTQAELQKAWDDQEPLIGAVFEPAEKSRRQRENPVENTPS